MSGSSTLDPDNFPVAPDRKLGRGHGTGALGPSDSSDSGSDVKGGTAAQELGDANLDSDTDSRGTGERAAVGRESAKQDGSDIDVDHVETVPLVDLEDLEGDEDTSARDRR